MEPTFDVLDAVTFVVFALLIAVTVILVVSLGQLPGQLARKWGQSLIVENRALKIWSGALAKIKLTDGLGAEFKQLQAEPILAGV